MELPALQRIAAFAAVVLALGVLGFYLLFPSAVGAASKPRLSAQRGSAAGPGGGSPGSPVPSGLAQAPPAQPSTSPPGSLPAAGGQRSAGIYQWLPFTASGLQAAARVAVRFGGDYGTYSYSENTTSYLAPMRGLMTSSLAGLLGRAYSAPGVASQRASQKQVSAATAQISSLRGFGPTSLVFVMVLTQRITDDRGRSQVSTSYAVTLTGADTSWQVSDIQLASAGNS